MRKLITVILAVTLVLSTATAQNRWTYYGAVNYAQQNIPVDNMIFSLCDGTIYSYSPGDTEVRIYNKTTGLSDVNIKFMEYCNELKCFVLIYNNSNIDLFFPDENGVVNMPQYMNSKLSDKTINDMTIVGSQAYVATNTGITVIDIRHGVLDITYKLDKAVMSCTLAGGKIYASVGEGLIAGNVKDNLLDVSKWELKNNARFQKLRTFSNRLYATASQLFTIDTETGEATVVSQQNPLYINNSDSKNLIFGNGSTVNVINAAGQLKTISQTNNFNYVSLKSGIYWTSCGNDGLLPYKLNEAGKLEKAGEALTLNSPIRNHCAFMNMTPYNRLLVAGGSLNYNGLNYKGTLYLYDKGKFFNFEDNITEHTTLLYRNMTGLVEDPNDPTHHFATSAETGLYEFRNGKFVAHYDNRNSILQSAVPKSSHSYMYVRTGALNFDPDGNLWMFNDEVDTVVKVRMKDGKWHGIYIEDVSKLPTFDHLVFDNDGRAWYTHRRTTNVHHAGLGCLDYNGTIANTRDDKNKFRYTFTNQDGTSYNPNTVDALAIDNNGDIWVGTLDGPFLVTDPRNYMNSNFRFKQVKVPRNDGTNNADYLLSGVPVSAIAIDDANRKWFGTKGNGLYLISADNIETIEHFTAENSPLVSNYISSLAINRETGEVMIGTDNGLMGYEAGKTSSSNKIKDKDLKIYPNPVRPDYYGDVTIEGLPYGAEVKIATTGGQVIKSGVSNSGKFKWDIRDAEGNEVGSGVYYILVSTGNSKEGARGRLVIVR